MANAAFIVIKEKDGTYTGIYCHWDGYPEYTGKILREHYNTEEKVRELISHGDASFIAPEIGEKNSFGVKCDNRYCRFYHRDRGDAWELTKPKRFKNHSELIVKARNMWCEYLYKFEDGQWNTSNLFHTR